jgi:hypothetical protein
MKEEMDMGIDKPGHERPIAQIDYLGSRRMLDRWTDLHDAIPLDENFAWLDDLPRLDVKQSGGRQHDRMGCRGRNLAGRAQGKRKRIRKRQK